MLRVTTCLGFGFLVCREQLLPPLHWSPRVPADREADAERYSFRRVQRTQLVKETTVVEAATAAAGFSPRVVAMFGGKVS